MDKGTKHVAVVFLVVCAVIISGYTVPLLSQSPGSDSQMAQIEEYQVTTSPQEMPADPAAEPPQALLPEDLVLGPSQFIGTYDDAPPVVVVGTEPAATEPLPPDPPAPEPSVDPVQEDESDTPAEDPPPYQEYTKVRSLGHLKELAELEGAQDFSYSTRPRRSGGWGPNDPTVPYEPEAERDIGEADIVKLVGNTLYILNAFRGLEIVDLCDPDDPKVIGNAPVLGFPDDMYIVGDRAYIIVSATYGFYSWRANFPTLWNLPLLQYRIGSRLLILDISSPYDPWIMREIPIEGFVSDSRRVGDVLYYVSNCRSWYNQYTGAAMEDMTYVMTVNIANPWDIYMMDSEKFLGRSFVTHVTTDHMYIAHWESVEGLTYGMTNITLLDISDPRGMIDIRDEFSVEGRVNDRYQMDEFEDTFRVVSHYRGQPRESELWIFDITDPGDVRSLGRLLVDDAGRLMATRFEGDRAYTIHYPGSTRMMRVPMPDDGSPEVVVPDPLEVIDLSDPAEPVLCDIFEMPGWVTHMEVRGLNILAIGVDDSEDEWNVAVSLFDVSDPWQVEMLDRVRLGGNVSTSTANWEPKALTVLDDEGLVLVPYSSRYRDENGLIAVDFGVQVVVFDLEEGNLELAGQFDQPDNVIRTRSLEERVLSTSNDHLVVSDITDAMQPRVTAVLELSTNFQDYRVIGGHEAVIVVKSDGQTALRVYSHGASEFEKPVWEIELGDRVIDWFWSGTDLHVLSTSRDALWRFNATVFSACLEDPLRPEVSDLTFTLPDFGFSMIERPRDDWTFVYDRGFTNPRKVQNPVLLEMDSFSPPTFFCHHRDILAIYFLSEVHLVGVGGGSPPALLSSIEVGCGTFHGLLPSGDDLFVVGSVYTGYRNHFTLYPVDLSSPTDPVLGEGIAIPGVPLDSSEDGTLVYTASCWYFPNSTGYEETLNVVRLEDGCATILHALDIKDKFLRIHGDIAVLYEIVKAISCGDDGEQTLIPFTMVDVVDLRAFEALNSFWIRGGYHVLYSDNDIMIYGKAGSSGIFVRGIQDPIDMPAQHFKIIEGGLVSHVEDGTIHIVQYKYGVRHLTLNG